MANIDDERKYLGRTSDEFHNDVQTSMSKDTDMVLNLGAKLDPFPSDQTPTPIRLLQKCEEMGLFQDLNVNPFEETFRKAAEGIRSGTAPLEISSLSVPNNADDSLHTPHVTFPLSSDFSRRKGPVSPRDFSIPIPLIQPETDPLAGSPGQDNDPEKYVVQEEADTSEETERPTSDLGCEDENSLGGTIQFLLRMPNGKMVKLSSLPVEQMDNSASGSKENDIPIIKVDSTFLKNTGDKTQGNVHLSSSSNNTLVNGYTGTPFQTSGHTTDTKDRNIDFKTLSMESTKSRNNVVKFSENKDSTSEFSKMSLAKLKLKQALMNNSCPASNLNSSLSVISSSALTFSRPPNSDFKPIEERRSSSQSDDAEKFDDSGHSLSTVEEKRRRNRAAAMRCREKRKTWVKELERRANEMLRINGQLQHEVSMLRDEVAQLKTLLLAHRDCPVTQALVQGKASLPTGSTLPKSVTNKVPQSSKETVSKDSKSPSSTILLQPPVRTVNSMKPIILLNNPPTKRKRLNSSANSPGIIVSSASSSVSVVTSSPSTSVVHTLVLPPKTSSALNPTFVNMIPSVLVTNPASASGTPVAGHPQVIYSQIIPGLPTLTPKPGVSVVAPRQPFILPKANASYVQPEKPPLVKSANLEMRPRSTHVLSTNVIKLNPNVMDCDTNDSDIEILDVKPVGS